MTHDDDTDADRLIETLEDALDAERAAHAEFVAALLVACNLDREMPIGRAKDAILSTVCRKVAKGDARIEAARLQCDRLRDALEGEAGSRMKAEAERDALMGMLVIPANGPFEGKWLVICAGIGHHPDLRLIHDTEAEAIATVRKAAGLEDTK
jgi:hypothetical protein